MSVAKIIELSSTSTKSFEDAIEQGIQKANNTVNGIKGAWIKEQKIGISNGKVTEYRVMMMVSFVID